MGKRVLAPETHLPNPNTQRSTLNAFTLIELLVVIAIIAILAAILSKITYLPVP